MNYVKFLAGTAERFDALPVKDAYTFYYVDESDLYLGDTLLSNGEQIAEALTKIQLNADAIKTLQDELDSIVNPDGGGNDSVSTQINELRTQLTALINANTEAIEAEETRAKGAEAELSAQITALSSTIDANETDIEDKLSALTQKVDTNTQNISSFNGVVSGLSGKVTDNETNISALQETTATLAETIDILVGEDAGQSVRAIALSELTKQLVTADAKENLDTLQEIAAWIQQHPEDASAMNEQISTNTSAIAVLRQTDATHDADIADLKEAVAALTGEGEDSGVLAQSKAYTDEQIGILSATVSSNKTETDNAIQDLSDAIDAINHEETGILAKAEQAITVALEELGLGTAAYQDVEAFDEAGAADDALAQAKLYTDNALAWGEIPETVTE